MPRIRAGILTIASVLAWLACALCTYWAVDAIRYVTGWRSSRSMGDVGAYIGAWVLPILALLAAGVALLLTRAVRRARRGAAVPPA